MTDPLNACLEKKAPHDLPDVPHSVGWTIPRRVVLADRANPLPLNCGVELSPVIVEYEVYGQRLGDEFMIESYLAHQGRSFVNRLDANSYLYLSRAMDYYDATSHGGGNPEAACAAISADLLLISYSSDWLYPPEATRAVAEAVIAAVHPVSYIEIPSSYGHDAFLLETEITAPLIDSYLRRGVKE